VARILSLVLFLSRYLFGSLAGVVPLAASLAFGQIAFEYGMDQSQFIAVGGIGTSAICLLTVLLLAGRADRASSYPLMARLAQRVELLAAIVLGAIAVTSFLSICIAAANLAVGRLVLEFPSVLWVVPTWMVLWFLAAAMGLILSTLVSRGGSHLVGYVLLTALLVANDQANRLVARGFAWLAEAISTVIWPVSTLLLQASAGIYGRTYWLAFTMTLAFGLLLFAFATLLFLEKDLVWSE
jgi:hypothetical protein